MEPKDPNDAGKDYGINWAPQLAAGETIVASLWVMPSGITKDSDSFTNTTTTILLSGGTARTYYPLTNRITTSAVPPRTLDRTVTIRVKEL